MPKTRASATGDVSGGSVAGRAAFAATVVLSAVVLFTPASGIPSGVPVNDKVVHCVLFAALAVTGRAAGIGLVPLVLALLAYAGISEVLQAALPIDRDGDLLDGLANTAGVLLGVGTVALVRGSRRLRR